MLTARSMFRRILDWPALAGLFGAAGAAVYAGMLWFYAHNQLSVLDEGLYLFKGWLYATGRYTPFQPYGPWTNQMPLAFLIPGWVQVIFGPGLHTGRMLAVLLGLLMLLGLWLTARRLGGAWPAALCVLALALNPAGARMLAMAASQGLVACLLAWTFFFSLGADRKTWQLLTGGLLAGAVVMVRINLLPLLPLLGLYVMWERGFRTGCWWLGGALLSFGGVHAAYWPGILGLWAKWLPLPFLRAWFPPANTPTWRPDNPAGFRVASFFLAFRYHFAALGGALAAWVLWPRGGFAPEKRRIAVFLSLLLATFFILHAWAALGNEYCVFCFPTYTAFYAGAGLLLAAVTLPAWDLSHRWRTWPGALAFLLLAGGMAYSAESATEELLGPMFYKRLLALPLPGLRGALLWQAIANKFGLEYRAVLDGFQSWFPVALAVTLLLALFAAAGLALRLAGRNRAISALSLGMLIFTILGGAFSPAPVLAGDYTTYDCPADVLPAYEKAGALLADSIAPGAKIFWAGYSPVTLLYLPGTQIYPAQLHGAYSFRISADDDALLKYGWWNEHLAEKWLAEADYVLAEARNLDKKDWLYGKLDGFEPVNTTTGLCHAEDAIMLYRRK